MIQIHPDGTFDLVLGEFRLEHCRAKISVDRVEEQVSWTPAASGELSGTSRFGSWSFSASEQAGRIELRLNGTLNAPADLVEVTVLEIPELAADHLLAEGLRMGGCEAVKLPCRREKEFESFYHCMITRDGKTLMLSMPLRQRQPGSFRGRFEGERLGGVRARYELLCYSGRKVELDPVTIEAGDGFALLENWTGGNIECPRDFSTPPEAGWNSWDYYRWTITEEEVLKNAEFIARDPVLSKHVKRIIIDDGWQYCYGEWEANPYFPGGMEFLAKELSKMGFEPGLWFAPSIIEPHCFIAQQAPEMLALSLGGQPCLAYECMRRFGFVLDPTVEKTRKHLRELFSRYAGMGYKYFKLDFLNSTLKAPRFHDGMVPRSEIVRRLLEPVYEGIDGRARILGCNYPFLAGNRMVDSVRIGADIHARWPNIHSNALAAGARFWANKRLWLNDPDFAVCRGVETSDDPNLWRLNPLLVFVEPGSAYDAERDMKLATATKSEVEILLGVVLMAAGAVNLSDDMTKLNAAGLELARKVVAAPSGDAAKPLDLFSEECPSLWLQRVGNGRRLMTVNWGESPRRVRLSLAEYGIPGTEMRDFWRDEPVVFPNGVLELELAPHSCRLFETPVL